MVQDPLVEVVLITTPDFTHRQMVDIALDAGKHVICEKPLATSIEDALHLARRASAVPQIVQLVHILRYAPFIQTLKGIVESGVVGSVIQVSAAEQFEYYHAASFFRRWHRFTANSGGLLVHKACHTLDIVNWIIGAMPVSVRAKGGIDTFLPDAAAGARCRDCSLAPECPVHYRPFMNNGFYLTRTQAADPAKYANDICPFNSDKDSVDNAEIHVTYDNGAKGSYTITSTGHRRERRFVVWGDQGSILANQIDGEIIIASTKASKALRLSNSYRGNRGGGDARLLASFCERVAMGRRPLSELISGLHALAIGVAATQSIVHGSKKVDLSPYDLGSLRV
jgi:predicted dehydrogenase